MKIIKGGIITGNEHSAAASWPASAAAATFGGPSDVWLQTWTAADINSASFGVGISAMSQGSATSATLTVESSQITVTYYVPCPETLDETGCITTFERTSIKIDERKSGLEKLVMKFALGPATTPTTFGDYTSPTGPVASMCVYDETNSLVMTLVVNKAGDTCETKPCWSSNGNDYPEGRGMTYKEDGSAAMGVTQIRLVSGADGKTKAQVKGSGKFGPLPLGVAAALDGHTSASMQIRGSEPFCLSAVLNNVRRNAEGIFQARE